jgi:cell division protease FtsH
MKAQDPKHNSPRKKLATYYGLAILIIIFLNYVVFPLLFYPRPRQVAYSQFMRDVDSGIVTQVEISNTEIQYATREGEQVNYFKTGIMNDPDLITNLEAKSVEFGAVIPERPNTFLSLLLTWGLPILFFVMMGRFVSRSLQGRMTASGMSFSGHNAARIYVPDEDKKDFSDVAGQAEAKESLKEIIDFLGDPQKYKAIGAKCPKGVLLVGPPGTGKTLIAKAVAGEADVPFFSISGSEFVEMFVGRGAAKVRELFEQASKKAPCIVFIDEIDTIGKKRDGQIATNDEREQTLNQLLTEMDGFDSNKGVIILAATNRPEILDPALLRPGRFDRLVRVELPDLQDRIALMKVHMRKVKHAEDIDYSLIARMTAGASGADMANIVNEAALRAVRMGREFVTTTDLEESIETVIAGQQKKNAILSDQEKEIVAYHEIGHALVAANQTGAAPVQKITIIPRTSGALGYTMQVEEEEKSLLSKRDALNRLEVLCGGRAAEEIVFNEITTGAANDIEKVTQLARQMVTQYGMSERFGMMALETSGSQYLGGEGRLSCSSETAKEIDEEVLALIQKSQDNARDILMANRDKLDQLTAHLIEKETITGAEFMEILAVEE